MAVLKRRVRGAGCSDDGGSPPDVSVPSQLTSCEEALVAHAAAGTQLDLVPGQAIDVSQGERWGPERVVRAEVLEALVVGALGPVHRRGVRLRGGRVRGGVDLSWAELAHPLSLVECYFSEPFLAQSPKLMELRLSGSRVTELDLSGATPPDHTTQLVCPMAPAIASRSASAASSTWLTTKSSTSPPASSTRKRRRSFPA